jgi:hypothetical protein
MFYEDNIISPRFLVELEFGNVDYCRGRKTGEPGEKPSKQGRETLEARERTNND